MSDDLVKRIDSLMVLLNMEREKSLSLGKHIEQLEAANLKQSLIKVDDMARIEQLGAALRHCINALRQYEMGDDRPRGPIPNDDLRPWLLGAMDNAIKVLEGKDD